MLTLCELRRGVRILKSALQGARVHRAHVSKDQLYLAFQGLGAKLRMLISCNPEFGRISEVDELPEPATVAETSLGEYVRAHLAGCLFAGISVAEKSRQVELALDSGQNRYTVLLSLLGSRSNTCLLDGERTIIHAARPLEKTREELKVGERWTDPTGEVRSEGSDRWESIPDELFLKSVQETYAALERAKEVETLSRRLRTALNKEQLFLQRKAMNLSDDLADARQAESYRKKGELLKGVIHTIQPGTDSVLAPDYETGERVKIDLDPRLSPAANLEALFAKYQKESRGIAAIEQQLRFLEHERVELERLGEALAEVVACKDPDPGAMRQLLSTGLARRLMNRFYPHQKPPKLPGKPAKKTQKMPARLLPRRYKTEDGLEIWVGRTDEGNDYLTTRMARGNDLFFHLEGYPGSHVVLRTEGRPDPPPSSILDAAELAVHFSKLKNEPAAEVHVAAVKDVKKPRNAKPGLVFVRRGKTMHLRRSSSRLRSILASRFDE